jgi:hypothetical protein
MLGKGPLTKGRAGLRPFACLAAAALLASSSSARAEPPNANGAAIAEAAKSVASFDKSLAIAGTATAAIAPTAVAQPSPSPVSVPPPPKDDGATLRTLGYIAGGIGIGGFIVFAIAGIGAKNAHDRVEEAVEACHARPQGPVDCEAAFQPAADGKRLQTIANIGLATGLAGIGLGATLIMVGNHSAHDVPAVATGPRGGMITFAGRF